MLEGLVSNLLNRVLGIYVQNFDPKQLSLGIWSGDVKLHNLELRREALDQLHLPLNVVEGHLGELTLSIPWSNLRGKPVKVNIENVFLLAAPKEDDKYDPLEEEKRAHAVKIEKLESAELLKERNTEGMSKEEQQKHQSFTASLTTAIIDNLQVTVRNIHIRYEDAISDPGHPFAAGLTLKEFTAISTDEHWMPTFIQSTSGSTHKFANLDALAMYWNTDTSLMANDEGSGTSSQQQRETILSKFQNMTTLDDSKAAVAHQFVLKPVSGKAGIEMDKTGRTDRIRMKINLSFDELGFVFDEDQYRDALMLVDLFHYFFRHQESKKWQPKVSRKEDPRAWIRFAGSAVLRQIQDRNRRWTWEYFRERRDDRRRYIELFKKKKREEKLTTIETTELDQLEVKLPYEDLRFWRSLARNELRKEDVGVTKPAQKQSWTSWVWGGGKKQEEEKADDSQMTEQQRNELYSVIDWNEQKALVDAVDLPADMVKMQLRMSLQTGSFALKRDPHGKGTNILRLLFDTFDTTLVQRPTSFQAKMSLGGLRLYDGTTVGSLFPQIVTVKDAPQVAGNDHVHVNTNVESSQMMQWDDLELDQRKESAFFNLSFEQNPLDWSADSAFSMNLRGMEIVYNPKFVVEVARFFTPPERLKESISALLESANATVESVRKQTRAGLEFALEEHKTINLHLNLQAPLIIVPDSVTEKSSLCLIMDAGHASISSELVDKNTIRDIIPRQKQQHADKDYQELEGLMYDKFNLKLHSTQLLIGPSVDATRAQLQSNNDFGNLHIIDRINMDFLIEICIIPRESNLTRFRVTGKLPVLHASISDAKYKNLIRLLDVAVPKFEDGHRQTTDGSQDSQALSPQPDIKARSRSKSVQVATMEQDLIVEEEDEAENPVGEQSSTINKTDEGLSFAQRNFQFKFVVDKLQGSLYQSDPENKLADRLLAELVGDRFSLDFYQTRFNMVAEVGLKSLVLEDHVEDTLNPEFKHIISSEDDSNQAKDLFHLKLVKVDPESPEFSPMYHRVATNLDVSVSTINLIVTRRTLLTLLHFILSTFTSPDIAGERTNDSTRGSIVPAREAASETGSEPSRIDKIRIRAQLKRIAVILNNDGIRLATLSLNAANVDLTLLGTAMQLGAKVGSLTLIDDINQGASIDSELRQLMTIQGDELVDATYESFLPDTDVYPGYDSAIKLRSGSVRINFVTEPFRKIVDFVVKFGKMQAIFNAARQAAANQASQMQGKASKMHFDILIKTPIVVFPRMMAGDKPHRDLLTAHLGEIYASNRFTMLKHSDAGTTVNEFSIGIRNVRVVSVLHYPGENTEELELLDNVDLRFDGTSVDHKPGSQRPELEMKGFLSDINMRITPQQLQLLLELSRSIPTVFGGDSADAVEEVLQRDFAEPITEPARMINSAQQHQEQHENVATPAHLGPELEADPEKWTKLDLIFQAGTIGLELLQSSATKPVGDLESASLSKFSLNQTDVRLRMVNDGALESELLIQSFTIRDTRKQETNKFKKIMSVISDEVKQQFMAHITMSGGAERSMLAILTIDSPRVILALDYLYAVQTFINAGLSADEQPNLLKVPEHEAEVDESDTASINGPHSPINHAASKLDNESTKKENEMFISFRANVVNPQVILLANPAISSSEAIVLGVKQIVIAKQHAMTLQIEKMGMFLCRMDRFDTSRLRIVDDFSIATSIDVRSHGNDSSMTNLQVDVEPLVLRLSLRDILLVTQIISRASELQNKGLLNLEDTEPQKMKDIKNVNLTSHRRRSSTAARMTAKSLKTQRPRENERSKPQTVESTILKQEEMNVQIEGIRVVLIGDKHELPMLDWSIKPFTIEVRDWSSTMTADTSIDTLFNVYNFSKSTWEPLIEPWTIGFHMSRSNDPARLSIDLVSRKGLELTLTSETIALASKTAQVLSGDEDVLSKPRGSDAPYRLRNYTGFTVNVWTHSADGRQSNAVKMLDGDETPWRFEDATTTRETLTPEGASGIVSIKLEGSGFETINQIPVNREGENIYSLEPRKDRILHRLLVEVKLGADSVKYITFRSPLVVENCTQIPIEIGIYSPEEGHLLKIEKIAPGDARPSPVGAAFMHSLVFRPDQGFGYTWSNERLFWKDLLRRPVSTITCQGEHDGSLPPFYFQINAIYNKNDPLTSVYPYMRIRLHAPVELQNLLPYDFKYRMYDKNTKKDWSNFLRKGGISPVHVVDLSHLLLLSVDLQDTPFKQSDFAIINSRDGEYPREKVLVVKDTKDLTLRLKLHYFNVPDSGGSFKVTVYSPYIILNRTGLELDVRSKSFLGAARAAAGQGIFANANTEARKATPLMFSFHTDDQQNRALIKVGDSGWSKPQSFNAIGSTYEATVPSSNGRMEMHLGVTVSQGEGKYNLTNIVTIAPRFVVNNKIGEELEIREAGSSEAITVKDGSLHALRFGRQTSGQQLCLCFPGLNNQWSSPFHISNVGRVHVKLAKEKQRQQLIKIDILMEDATLFISLTMTKHWPFVIQNESDIEFFFYQANPNINEDEEDRGSGWRPIRYRLPPRSIMPYAWDYPASRNKDLVLNVNGKERNVKLAEIGPQHPMRLAPKPGSDRSEAVDIDVVADGPKQILVLSKYKPSLSLYRQKTGKSTLSTSAGFEVKEQDTNVTFTVQLRLAGIGISVINQQMRELLYLTFRETEVKYDESPLYQVLNWTTKWIQIDNQLYGGIFPILLYPSVVPKTGKEMESHPIFRTAITRVKDDSYGVLYVKYFTLLLQQLTFEIDEDFIYALLEFVKIPGASWSEEKEGRLCDGELDIPEPQQEEQGQDIYFELLHLQPMQLDLSFVRTERINAEDTISSTSPLMFVVNVLTMSLGNVNDAPLRYNALLIENARISVGTLVAKIQNHYVQESLRQVHLILGSADFLGNPVGLFNNVSSGVRDIFYEPYQGLVMTDRPQDLGLGIAKGASSFVKKSVFGFSDSAAKFTASVSKGLAAATLDREFQDQRRISKSRNRPKHALYGITSGGNAFASSLASGIGGLARHPLEGAEKEGVGGFMKGLGKGILGLATKPAVGAFDLASNLAEGVRNTTTVFDQDGLERVRLTRFIGQDGIVRPYSQREALGQFWLKTIDNGKYFSEEYIAHLEINNGGGEGLMAMLTYNGIMLVRMKKLTTEWEVLLRDVQKISKERTGINITLKEGRNGPFIPVQDEQSRNWLYKQIAVAVNAYNERWQAKV